jgi:RNA polymerase sigma-70 factor (TIGR02960 family)
MDTTDTQKGPLTVTVLDVGQNALARAQAGDEGAFHELTAPYRRELQFHCYRMLGSLTDAEDALQETLLAAWRGLSGYEGRASLRTWLYRIATNRCLNGIRDGRWRISPPEPVPPFQPPEPSRREDATWLEPYPDMLLDHVTDLAPGPDERYEARETVELAFIESLQNLPPRQTAALVLREVLGFSAAEVAAMLDTSEIAIKSLLRRARATLDARRSPQQVAPPPDSNQERELARRFADAFTAGDIDGIVALLTDDAWLSMPPAPHQYCGPAAIAAFLRVSLTWAAGRLSLRPMRANTQPAFGCYLVDSEGMAEPAGLIVLTLAGDGISRITRFLDQGRQRYSSRMKSASRAGAIQRSSSIVWRCT